MVEPSESSTRAPRASAVALSMMSARRSSPKLMIVSRSWRPQPSHQRSVRWFRPQLRQTAVCAGLRRLVSPKSASSSKYSAPASFGV